MAKIISKTLSRIKIERNKAFKKIVDWRVKNDILKDQISRIEKLKDFPILSIAVFLLKTQLVEFELKGLITKLDLHLIFSSYSKVLERKVRTSKEMDWMTLGMLREELNYYEGKFLEGLQKDLQGLNRLRRKFVHHLFDLGTINALIKEADRGLEMVNKVLKDIEKVNSFLKKYDPLTELANKKIRAGK